MNQYETVDQLVNICIESIKAGEKSKITEEVAQLRGMSTPKIRHLLNNICSRGKCHYLEIGTWAGSTLFPAIFENEVDATAIDNWSQFGPDQQPDRFDAEKFFKENIHKYIGPENKVTVHDQDCFVNQPEAEANVFFYDGDHSAAATALAITIYGQKIEHPFILIVDDLELDPSIWQGLKAALNSFTIHAYWELKKKDGYHEGLWIGVVEKV